jgi:hypothetical protein
MDTRSNSNEEQTALQGAQYEALLRSEVEFWQEVIANCPSTQPVESQERMRQALALAEMRLARVSEETAVVVSQIQRVQ